jgi:hypothetical protein
VNKPEELAAKTGSEMFLFNAWTEHHICTDGRGALAVIEAVETATKNPLVTYHSVHAP